MTDNSNLEGWKLNHQATVNSGAAALKVSLLINGGAAVAVLTFIGGLANQGRVSTSDISVVANALTWFGYGVVSSAVAATLAYATNRSILESISSANRTLKATSTALQLITVTVVVVSLILFVVGLLSVRDAIPHLHYIDPFTISGGGPG